MTKLRRCARIHVPRWGLRSQLRGGVRHAAMAACLAACGGESGGPGVQNPEPVHEEAHVPKGPVMQVKGELGSLDPDAVKKGFHALERSFLSCQKEGLARVHVLSGSVKFFLRIAEDGSAKWAYLEETDLGDRATERCLTDAALGARWPKPQGGEAEARYAMELPLYATRPANDWPAEKVTGALSKHGGAIAQCQSGAHGPLHATMYVGPGGHVLAAGVAVSSQDDLERADCLAGSLLKLKGLPSPGSWPAKVSFTP